MSVNSIKAVWSQTVCPGGKSKPGLKRLAQLGYFGVHRLCMKCAFSHSLVKSKIGEIRGHKVACSIFTNRGDFIVIKEF